MHSKGRTADLPVGLGSGMEVVAVASSVRHQKAFALVKFPVGHQVVVVSTHRAAVKVGAPAARTVERRFHALPPIGTFASWLWLPHVFLSSEKTPLLARTGLGLLKDRHPYRVSGFSMENVEMVDDSYPW